MEPTSSRDSQIAAVFVRLFGIAPEVVTDQLRRGGLERWDSLGHIELLESLRQEFDIQISLEEAIGIETVQDVRRVVTSHLDRAAQTPE